MKSLFALLAAALRRAPLALAFVAAAAFAHGSTVGDIEIGHPYATPSLPGTTNALPLKLWVVSTVKSMSCSTQPRSGALG